MRKVTRSMVGRCAALFPISSVIACCSFSVCLAEQPDTRTALAGEVPLVRLVDFAAQQLELNIEYDPAELRGSVHLRLGEGVSDAQLWELTNRLLASKGLTTIRMPGDEALSVVGLTKARTLARIEHDEAWTEAGHAQPGFVRVRVSTRFRPSEYLRAALAPLLSSGGSVEEIVSNELLLISDQRPRVIQAIELLELIDRPYGTVVDEIDLQHQSAAGLVARISQIADKSETVTGEWRVGELIAETDDGSILIIAPANEIEWWRSQIARFDRAGARGRRTYVPEHHGVEEVAALISSAVETSGSVPLSVISDALTGSIIVTATDDEHTQAEEILRRLNDAPASSRRPMRTFALRNRQAEEVLSVIDGLVAAGIFEAQTSVTGQGERRGSEPAADQRGSQQQPSGSDQDRGDRAQDRGAGPPDDVPSGAGMYPDGELPALSITADLGLNSLIAIGEPLLLDRLESLIEDLDIRQPQVEVQVLLLSLSESQSRDLGVELEGLIRAGSISIGLSSLFGLSTSNGIVDRSAGGSGFTGVVLNPGEFASVIRALETLNDGRSLSMPKILVTNNEQAVLSSVIQQPTVSINASDTVATTSFGGFEDAGTTITVEPQISEADHLVLTYSVSLSSFVGESSDPSAPPPRQQNQIQSVATIPDGFTIAVGGIELLTEADAESRVPLLGQIPLVKELVRNRSRSNNRSRFYVFIRASVLRDAGFADLRYLSDVAVDAAGIDDGWPVVEPRIIK